MTGGGVPLASPIERAKSGLELRSLDRVQQKVRLGRKMARLNGRWVDRGIVFARDRSTRSDCPSGQNAMSSIIYIVGLIVIVLAVLGMLGLR